MPRVIIRTGLTILLLLTALLADADKKNILLLHSYHEDMTWVKNINRAVWDTLIPDANNIVLYVEYMDTKRHHSKKYYALLKTLYKNKYENTSFDLILSTDNNAFDFLLKNRDELFGDVPVAFSGVNGYEPAMLEGTTNFTGVAETFSARETVELILKLHPGVKQIYIINDYLPTGLAWKKDIQKALRGLEDRVRFIYSDNVTLEELKRTIDGFGDDTVVLMGVYSADRENNYITYERVGEYLLGESRAPVYCLLNFNISSHVIGGKVIGGYFQGKSMSEIALRILRGSKPEDIPVATSASNEFVFNYRGIKKYNIDESLLPPEHTMLNKPSSLYEEYRYVLNNLILLALAALVVAFLLLLVVHHKQKSTEEFRESFLLTMLRFAPIVIIPIVSLVVVWLFIQNAQHSHEELKEIEKQNYIELMKSVSKREVDRYIELIQYHMGGKEEFFKTEADLKAHMLDIAGQYRYGKSGYLGIIRDDGEVLAHIDQRMVGQNLRLTQNEEAKKIFSLLKEATRGCDSGFATYRWTNPSTRQEEMKITYVRCLSQWGWLVTSGVYLDEINDYIEKESGKTSEYTKTNLGIIITTSLALVVITLVLSLIISNIIKKIFDNYKANIHREMERNKQKDMLLFEQSKKAAMGELIGIIAHQLKQPLNGIMISKETLMDDYEYGEVTEKTIEEFSETVDEQVRFMSTSIEDLRNFFRPNKKVKPFSANKAIQKGLAIIATNISGKGIEIVSDYRDDATLNGIDNELQQVVINIVNNAKEVLVETRPENPYIRIRTMVEEGVFRLTIEDNGGGIPNNIIDKVFDSYFTTKGEKGTGIGLNLSKLIVEESFGGTISVHNTEEGACFTVTLPI